LISTQASTLLAKTTNPCIISKAIYSIEENSIGVRLYQVNKCSSQIIKQTFNDELKIDIVSKIFDGKKVIIPEDLHDLIINYFVSMIQKTSPYNINQKYIIISDYLRYAINASSFINNLENATKIKVYDKTAEQTVDMVVLSTLNNLIKQPGAKRLLEANLTLFNLTKTKILLKNFSKDFTIGKEFSIHNFSTLSLEKFIKKDFLRWSIFSKSKSINPMGKKKAQNVIKVFKKYLLPKISKEFLMDGQSEININEPSVKKYTTYLNGPGKKKPKEISRSLVITGSTVLESIEALKIRGSWLRKDHLEKKILEFSEMSDKRIPSNNPKITVVNLILLYGYMDLMGYEKAYIQESNFEEGFLLHPDYH